MTTAPPPAETALPAAIVRLLRGEAALALLGAVLAYRHNGGGWDVFAALFLLPDIAILGYLRGPRIGALCYNAAHTYLAPAALGAAALGGGWTALTGPALIWAAHIGFDRLLGYGLKRPTAFGSTHLNAMGHAPGRI